MKKFLLPLLLFTSLLAQSQTYNNSWINYSQTYYKFKVGATGLYRIKQSALAAMSIQNIPVEQFQLWRNGQQIPLYTTIQTGTMGAGDYIEFWGERNDGVTDKPLFRYTDFQLNDKYSLETDTASFFLTIHTTISENKRLTPTANGLPTGLTPEPYFIHTAGKYYREKINLGIGYPVGSNLYSSAYDSGEGWSSADLGAGATRAEPFTSLMPYTGAGAPVPKVKVNLTGNFSNPRQVEVQINGTQLTLQTMDFWDYLKIDVPATIAQISSGSATIQVINRATVADRIAIAQTELIYARQFNFGGADNFTFELPAKAGNSYLEIEGFNFSGVSPVLYDFTNGQRYVCDVSNPTFVKVVLQPSTVPRKLMLITQAPAFPVTDVTSMQQRNFINFALPANQGNYLIIANAALTQGPGGTNPIDAYKTYRSSAAGGSYNAKIYMIDQLIDQFAFGIKIHPESIRNFTLWARNTFAQPVKDVLLFGKGVRYDLFRSSEGHPAMDKLNLIPTFGVPASDILLTANPGLDQIPQIPIGRISAINAQEVADYLVKVIQYEQQQASTSPLIADKAWMKNVVHVVGASDANLQSILDISMSSYKKIISDTFYGARVSSFSKTSVDPVEQSNSIRLQNLFQEGIGIVTYFGHSSASTLEYNLDNPQAYNNQGKYPIFILLGCQAGNLFNFNLARLDIKETISEKFVLAQERGGIASLASTSLGIVHYLDIHNTETYNALAKTKYGSTLGEVMKESIIQAFNVTTQNDPYCRMQCEQATLHGDPAIKLYSYQKPDYVIEAPLVKISPSLITVGDPSFKVNASFLNLGKAISKKIVVKVERTYPDNTTHVVQRDTIPGIRYMDSLSYTFNIVGTRDKGLNKITITVDADNEVDELYETNNSVTKEFFIYEDEARPVSPYNYAIVSQQNISLYASTANPFSALKQYNLEIDTTKLFNSSLKVTRSINSSGGLLEFTPGITFIDGTVYYWRVAPAVTTGQPNWNYSSFIYMANHVEGFNQSHYYQHLESSLTDINLNTQRKWAFDSVYQNVFIRNTIYPDGGTQNSEFTISVNGSPFIGGGCNYNGIIFNVFPPNSLKPWKNSFSGGFGLYKSLLQTCGPDKDYNFEYVYSDSAGRANMMNFLQNVVPDGYYVTARGNIPPVTPVPPVYPDVWKADEAYYGAGNSLYHILKNEGFAILDSFNRPRTWIFAYRKNSGGSFEPKYTMGATIYDKLTLDLNIKTSDTTGYIQSPLFGIAKTWKKIEFKGASLPEPLGSDSAKLNIIGVDRSGQETVLVTDIDPALLTYDISGISADVYPYLKLKLYVKDAVSFSPYQLEYWRVDYDPVPEAVIAPNIFFKAKDTVDVGEPVEFKVAFKNITNTSFSDSMKVKLSITDKNNLEHIVPLKYRKLLASPDTIQIGGNIITNNLPGLNYINLEANPDNDQDEQYHFNNFAFRNLYVRPDSLNPLLDVTFDGQHILNRDIVSPKPDIIVKLKDEAKWMSLNDTSLLTVQVRYPNGTLRRFYFNNDTLRFTPAGQAPTNDNTATINFKPYFTIDGEYELIVTGKDRSENGAGAMEYRIMFEVINKPMISNMLNYPNPFTTSTAFVFTITGSEVPQNIKIEIMTITGKIVREITKNELGPLQIGRNITEFKWDGTDQYGSKLANGIYLYRVVTNLNGKSLDKYKAKDDNTDKYFNKGYGKMYLMR